MLMILAVLSGQAQSGRLRGSEHTQGPGFAVGPGPGFRGAVADSRSGQGSQGLSGAGRPSLRTQGHQRLPLPEPR